jgi:tetratricopeptide (TPR) repeat protein
VAQALWTKLSGRWPLLKDIRTGFVVSLLLAATAILAFYVGLPNLAYSHNQRGLRAQEMGQYTTAVAAFRQAVSLAPEMASYHFNSGNAYERLGDFDRAIAEYQRALDLDDCLWPVYNSLGVLYLIERENPDAALTILLAGLEHTKQQCPQHESTPAGQLLAEGVIRKNIGWAYLERGLPQSALDELAKADLALADYEGTSGQVGSVLIYRVESLRLQALAHEALQDQVEAQKAWASSEGFALSIIASETCRQLNSLANIYCSHAQIWAAEAQERLNTP